MAWHPPRPACRGYPSVALGDAVLVTGLKAAPHLNGLEGVVRNLDVATGRWQIDLGPQGTKALKEDNIVLPQWGDFDVGDLIRDCLLVDAADGSDSDFDAPAPHGSSSAPEGDIDDYWEGRGELQCEAASNGFKTDRREDPTEPTESRAAHGDWGNLEEDASSEPTEPRKAARRGHRRDLGPGIAAKQEVDFSNLSVAELKKTLAQAGVPFFGVTEKSELVALLVKRGVKRADPESSKTAPPKRNPLQPVAKSGNSHREKRSRGAEGHASQNHAEDAVRAPEHLPRVEQSGEKNTRGRSGEAENDRLRDRLLSEAENDRSAHGKADRQSGKEKDHNGRSSKRSRSRNSHARRSRKAAGVAVMKAFDKQGKARPSSHEPRAEDSAGVWAQPPSQEPRAEERAGLREQPPSHEPRAEESAGVWAQTPSHEPPAEESAEDNLSQWLSNLDGGRGSMLCYLGALQKEFGSLKEIAASVMPMTGGGSVLKNVDPVIFEALGMKKLGHQMLLAKGIVALHKDDNNKHQ